MEKLTEILKNLEQGKISADNAEEQVLRLFSVSGRSEQLATFVQWLEDNHSIKIHDMIVVDYIRYGG